MAIIMTEDQQEMVQLAKQFAEGEIAPYSQEMDEANKMRPEIVAKMAELGFMGINIPQEYGGAGLDEVTKVLVIEEIAKVDASVAELLSVHTLVSDIIMKQGNEEQKKKYLAMASSGKVGAFALTEPGAGSDAAAAKTKAIADGDDYVIDGTKCFISNMGQDEGDYVVLIALTEPEKKTKGMSAIIVDRGTPDKEAAMAKYYASENAVAVCNRALQIHGGYGYMKDYAIERMYRDTRIVPLYEGTSEVQKMVISRAVIKG